ncbi:hypothetical protein Y1Q_0022074 [Alligator mississippiensis]|uniref:Uncharacterized protein n=1 Tax=Alligator mississippiensis TaxID=8496 RepID=A0A151NTC6_ALLMI|nr:hypothetical protein Y1Q_0022074 [Alligator mississippiensis]
MQREERRINPYYYPLTHKVSGATPEFQVLPYSDIEDTKEIDLIHLGNINQNLGKFGIELFIVIVIIVTIMLWNIHSDDSGILVVSELKTVRRS